MSSKSTYVVVHNLIMSVQHSDKLTDKHTHIRIQLAVLLFRILPNDKSFHSHPILSDKFDGNVARIAAGCKLT